MQPSGRPVASSGFDVKRDGFAFANYGNSAKTINLTAGSMKDVFGTDVCARVAADGCTLTAPAAFYMSVLNNSMGDGHCFGMATFAALAYDNLLRTTPFGAASTYGLQDNGQVTSEIAKLFITQGTQPERSTTRRLTVAAAIDALKQGWATHRTYVLGIDAPDGSGGHAITPVGLRDLGGGKFGLVVYDNNYPGQEREMTLDPVADTWSYTLASKPLMVWTGNAHNQLELSTPAAALKVQQCPVCKTKDNKSIFVLLSAQSVAAGGRVSVTDTQGQPIPGVKTEPMASGDAPDAMLVEVPAKAAFRVTVTGADVPAGKTAAADVSIIGGGWTDTVSAVQLSPGESDSLTINPGTGAFLYASSDAEIPTLGNTIDEGSTSYGFTFTGASLDADGGTYLVSPDAVAHTERITALGTGPSRMQFTFTRIDTTKTHTFATSQLTIDSGEALVAAYGAWRGEGQSLSVGIGAAATASVTKTVTLKDE